VRGIHVSCRSPQHGTLCKVHRGPHNQEHQTDRLAYSCSDEALPCHRRRWSAIPASALPRCQFTRALASSRPKLWLHRVLHGVVWARKVEVAVSQTANGADRCAPVVAPPPLFLLRVDQGRTAPPFKEALLAHGAPRVEPDAEPERNKTGARAEAARTPVLSAMLPVTSPSPHSPSPTLS
jgi:hypothetical protein